MMDIYELIYDTQLDFEDLCDRNECGECKYTKAHFCTVWYTFDRLNMHGYLNKGLNKEEICSTFYRDHMETDDSDIAIGEFIHWLYDEGYTKGVEEVC